jgi:hypothetical protein
MRMRDTIRLRLFALLHLPMLSKAGPKVCARSDRSVTILLPMRRRNRSFRGALAFGPMMMAAECAAGYLFGEAILRRNAKIGWVITSCEAVFMKATRTQGAFEALLPDSVDHYLDSVERSGMPMDVALEVSGKDAFGALCGAYRFNLRLQPSGGKK